MRKDDIKKILEGLEVTDEQLGKIVALGDNDTAALVGDITALKSQLADRDKDIEGLKKSAAKGEELTQQLTELQGKYEADTKALQQAIEQRDYADAVRSAISEKGIRFTSKAAESYFMSQAESKQMKIENGKLMGFDDFHRSMVEADKGAFVQEDAADVKTPAPVPSMRFSGETGQSAKSSPSPAMLAAQRFNAAHSGNQPITQSVIQPAMAMQAVN